MPPPSFSIVIGNFNNARFLPQALESCFGQDYTADRVEVIVVDDGSTDDSIEVLECFAGRPGLQIIAQENRGQAAAIATGVSRASREWVCLLDSDDVYEPNKLSAVAKWISSSGRLPERLFLCHDLNIFDNAGGQTTSRTWFDLMGLSRCAAEFLGLDDAERFPSQFPFAMPLGQVYSRALIDQVLEAIPLHDWKRHADAALAHGAVLIAGGVNYIHKCLARYRVHETNVSKCRIRDGEFIFPQAWRKGWPKLLQIMEQFSDSLDGDEQTRNRRLAYVDRMRRLVRVSSLARRFAEPSISIIVEAAGASVPALDQTIRCIRTQSHGNLEIVVASASDEASDALSSRSRRPGSADRQLTFAAVGPVRASGTIAGYRASTGQYFCFVKAGDEIDPTFVERHIDVHQHLSLCAATCSDVRLIDAARTLVYDSCFLSAGTWKTWLEHFPPFSVALESWAFSTRSATVFRRTWLTDAFFEHIAAAGSPEICTHAEGLLHHIAHVAGGATRLAECLTSLRVSAGIVPRYLGLRGATEQPTANSAPSDAAAMFLFSMLCAHYDEFKRRLGAAEIQRFVNWLLARNEPMLVRQMAERASAGNADPELLALLRTLGEQIP